MNLRFAPVAIAGALVLGACAADQATVSDTETSAAVADTETSAAVSDTSAAPVSDTVGVPATTVVPNLAGPWRPGGAERGGDESVIIDADAGSALPGTLSRLAWPTDWTRRTVEDWDEFRAGLGGTDPRDGIPPIDSPTFESVAAASEWVAPQEPGALVQVEGEARFYPLSILTRHEIVNDAFGDIPVAVTFCPLCNTAVTFDRRIDGDVLRLGVSGLLRNSDLVMWDSATTSLWQQVTGEALIGEYAGSRLDIVPSAIVSFEQFAADFPDGVSLAAESVATRDRYGFNPYRGYSSSARPFLFDGEIDESYAALSRVLGIDIGDEVRSYPFELLADRRVVNDEVGGVPVVVFWGGSTTDALDEGVIADSQQIGTAIALDPVVDDRTLVFEPGPEPGTFVDIETGSTWSVLGRAIDGELGGRRLDLIPHANEFWFAWQAFYGADNVYAG